MKCDDVRARLTGYLDGELEGDRGSAVRGHLRGCEACRQAALDEAALRDGLRALPPIDPPPSLWAGVQARLAAAEVADAERPAWRRALARWAPQLRLGLAGVALAAAALLLVWHTRHRAAEPALPAVASQTPVAPPAPAPAPPPPAPAPAPAPAGPADDVSAELAAAPAAETASYAQAASELMKLADDARAHWSEDRRQAFDTRVAELRHQIAAAHDERPRQRAYRALIRYLQRAAIRDDVALADTGGMP